MWTSPGLRGNIGLAQEHGDRAFSIAMKTGNPYLRVYAQAVRGLSHIVAGSLTSAIEDLSDALSFARSRKAGLENEPRILADLANAYRLNGDSRTALTTVDEAIKVASERHARIPECLARIVRADLLLRSTRKDQKAEGRQELESARALMRKTRAMLFETFVNEVNVEQSNTRQISTKASHMAKLPVPI
jgi:hypothetical protein